MTIKQHTVLITGLRGFTGHYLAAALRAYGAKVVGLVQGSPQCPEEIACELTDARAVHAAVAQVRPTHVVHWLRWLLWGMPMRVRFTTLTCSAR